MSEAPKAPEPPKASAEAPSTPSGNKGPDSRTARVVTSILHGLGKESPHQVFKTLSEGEKTTRSLKPDWKKATTRSSLHRELSSDAKAWYRAHKADIDDAVTNTSDSPKDRFRNLADAINTHREIAGVSLKSDIDRTRKSGDYTKAVGERIDQITADRGRKLTRRETARIKEQVLIDSIKAERNAPAVEAAAIAAKAAEDEAAKVAEDAAAKAKDEPMLKDPEFIKIQMRVSDEKGLDLDKATKEQLKEVEEEASAIYNDERRERADRHKNEAKSHPSYKTELFRLTNSGVEPNDARNQALEFAKATIAKEARQKAADEATPETKTADQKAEAQATARENKRIMAQPGFNEDVATEMERLTKAGEALDGKTKLQQARETVIETRKQADRQAREAARDSTEYFLALARLTNNRGSIPDDEFARFEEQALNQAVASINKGKEREGKAKPAEAAAGTATAGTESADAIKQTPEDVLKGLVDQGLVDINSDMYKSLSEAMNADPESAQAVSEKIQKAKAFQEGVLALAHEAGIAADAQEIFTSALAEIVDNFKDEPNSETAGVTSMDKFKILKILTLLLKAVGVAALGTGVGVISGAGRLTTNSK